MTGSGGLSDENANKVILLVLNEAPPVHLTR